MIKVMVAEDSVEQNSTYCNYLTKDENIEVISSTYDGESTIKEYLKFRPDVLILDLNLPILDGIGVINNLLMYSEERKKCNIIVISGFIDYRLKLTNVSKIYSVMNKPCNYNSLITMIKEIAIANNELQEDEIKDLFFKLKINYFSKGTPYLIEGIREAYKRPELICNISMLYEIIGLKYNIKLDKVQRSIRGTIDTMNNHIPRYLLCSFFHTLETETISPKYFFEIVIDYFKSKK